MFRSCTRSLNILQLGSPVISDVLTGDPEILHRLVTYLKPGPDSFVTDVTAGFFKKVVLALVVGNMDMDNAVGQISGC